MKFPLVLLFVFASFALFSQNSADVAYSSNSPFNWEMFKGKINPNHLDEMGKNTGAVTVSSLTYETEVRGKNATVKVSALFHPFESWTRYPKLDNPDEALNHEKRHFDICEIYARKIRKALSSSRYYQSNFNEELSDLFKKTVKEYREEQMRYDKDTKHSIDQEQQKKWDAKIDSRLTELSKYSNSKVAVTLS